LEIGICMAITVSLMTNLASLLKHRGCQRTEPIHFSKPLQAIRALAASRWFAAGWALAALAWLVHIAALSMAPISLVQAVLAGGAVTLAVMSQRLFGERVERRQWLALGLGGAGLVLLVLTVPHFSGNHSEFSLGAILGFEGGLVLLGSGLALGRRSERLAVRRGVISALLAGVLFALAGVAIKGLTAGGSSIVLIVPLVAMVVVCGILAQYMTVAALQTGGAIEAIGLMGLVANATQIIAGVVVFGDPLSPSPAGLALQVTAFAMVCVSALLMPGSARRDRDALGAQHLREGGNDRRIELLTRVA
jgi:drug/metabolite transporter (DMT)-like permease